MVVIVIALHADISGRRQNCIVTKCRDGIKQPAAMTDCRDAEILKIFGSQTWKQISRDGILFEYRLILTEMQGTQPCCQLHGPPKACSGCQCDIAQTGSACPAISALVAHSAVS